MLSNTPLLSNTPVASPQPMRESVSRPGRRSALDRLGDVIKRKGSTSIDKSTPRGSGLLSPSGSRPQRTPNASPRTPNVSPRTVQNNDRRSSRRPSVGNEDIPRRSIDGEDSSDMSSDDDGGDEGAGALFAKCFPAAGSASKSKERHIEWLRKKAVDIFVAASDPITVPPGQTFIEQGQASGELFLLSGGSAILRRKKRDGREEELGAIRKKGDTLGELSFLLGTTAVVSVVATPIAAGHTSVMEATVVYKLANSRALELIKEQPEKMERFYWYLATLLATRVSNAAEQTKRLLNAGARRPSLDSRVGAVRQRSALEIAQSFKIVSESVMAGDRWAAERDFIMETECAISEEVESRPQYADVRSHVYLFATHLCIEQPLLMLFRRREAIKLADVLGVVHVSQKTLQEQAADGDDNDRFAVEMRGRSLRLSMPRELARLFEHQMREAVLRAVDLTDALKGDDEKREENSKDLDSTDVGNRKPQWPKTGRSKALVASAPVAAERSGASGDGPATTKSNSDSGGLVDPVAEALRLLVSGNIPGLAGQQQQLAIGTDGAAGSDLNLSADEWRHMLKIATSRLLRRGQKVIRTDRRLDALLMVVAGHMSVQVERPGRPEAIVVGKVGPGNILGEFSLLLGDNPSAEVIVESEDAVVVRFPHSELRSIFANNAVIAGKFYCFLATRQAEKLRRITQQEEIEIALPHGAKAPHTMGEIATSDAFLLILHEFLNSHAQAPVLLPLLEFVYAVREMQREADTPMREAMISAIYTRYGPGGSRSILGGGRGGAGDGGKPILGAAGGDTGNNVLAEVAAALDAAIDPEKIRLSYKAKSRRHCFDGVMDACLDALGSAAMADFVSSSSFERVLALKAKEFTPVSAAHFKLVRSLGEGAFGKVVEVVKRDTGMRYAMKIMEKKKVAAFFGEDEWEGLVLIEKNLLADVHHPLIINLAYAFQNIQYLVLVMDLCAGGDLTPFGEAGEQKLPSAAVQFVGMECVAILVHLHRKCIMYRDMKPHNLLLDVDGHVRLCDFGVSEQGKDGASPKSTVETGSGVYVAPEVRAVHDTRQPYGMACDWFSLGVVLYELTEKAFPFGDKSQGYWDVVAQYVQPQLTNDTNDGEVPGMFDLLAGLLDWDPARRLGGTPELLQELLAHEYWADAVTGNHADWELVESRRLRSPLLHIAHERVRKRDAADKQRTDLDDLMVTIQKELEKSEKQQTEVKRLEQSFNKKSSYEAKLLEEELEYYVEGWEFTSAHAVSNEYTDGHKALVSIF